MIESFVDLTYRGIGLGRRIKLTQVRPSTGYLEMPTPMPVGTELVIATDEGVLLPAVVTRIHEQIGGSDRVPGMTVRPELADAARTEWWQARVALPEAPIDTQLDRAKPVTVRPRSHTIPAPPPAGALDDEPPTALTLQELLVPQAPAMPPPVPPPLRAATPAPVPAEGGAVPVVTAGDEDAKRTMVMNALDQEMLAQLTETDGTVEHLVRRTGEHQVVDDGMRTTVMDAVDPAALGLDVSASGSMPAATTSGEQSVIVEDGLEATDDAKATPAGVKKRKKKR